MNIPILMYHDIHAVSESGYAYGISKEQFRSQLECLRENGFNSISFNQLFRHLKNRALLPARPVILSFDDGYTSFLDHAVPLMSDFGFHGTVFLVAGQLGGYNSWDSPDARSRLKLMGRSQVREVLAAGFEIGSHSMRHPDHAALTVEEICREVEDSRKLLEDEFGCMIAAYSYPYGRHDARCTAAVKAAGYSGAVSIFSNSPDVTQNVYSMRRIFPHRGDGRWRFAFKVSTLYLRIKAFRDRRRNCAI